MTEERLIIDGKETKMFTAVSDSDGYFHFAIEVDPPPGTDHVRVYSCWLSLDLSTVVALRERMNAYIKSRGEV